MKVEVDGVNFRCLSRLRKEVKKAWLKEVKRSSAPFPDVAERQERMVEYLKKYGYINQRKYSSLNVCSRYCAVNDLKAFMEQGIIAHSGTATHKVYLLAE